MKITDPRRRAEVAADIRELGAPQPFRLHGDGRHTAAVATKKPKANLAGALAEARYLDWMEERRRIGSE